MSGPEPESESEKQRPLPGPGVPTLKIERLEQLFCGIHGEPYRIQWPKGFAICSFAMLKAIVDDPVRWQFTGNVDSVGILAGLDVKPACCRARVIGADVLIGFYKISGIGRFGLCRFCNLFGTGTEYILSGQKFDHVCFNCVVNQIIGPQ